MRREYRDHGWRGGRRYPDAIANTLKQGRVEAADGIKDVTEVEPHLDTEHKGRLEVAQAQASRSWMALGTTLTLRRLGPSDAAAARWHCRFRRQEAGLCLKGVLGGGGVAQGLGI